MIKTKSLQHTPETMGKMQTERTEGEEVKETVEKATEFLLNRYRDQNVFRAKGEARDMNNKKEENEKPRPVHGSRG